MQPKISLLNLQHHPLAQRFSDLMREWESLPIADPRQTAVLNVISAARDEAERVLNEFSREGKL